MAKIICEYLLLKFFFPEMRERKKQSAVKQNFLQDMRFNLSTGIVDKTTRSLVSRRHVNSIIELYEREPPLGLLTPQENTMLIQLIDDMNWIGCLKGYTDANKIQLLKCFTIKKLKQGQRVSAWQFDYIDSFNLILRGKIGIFYPDQQKIRVMDLSHVTNCDEKEAYKLLKKQ